MKTQISTLLAVLTFLLFSCVDVMDQTIFIPDKDDPNLPAYTEWGYNSFGAEYDGYYFLMSDGITPCEITYSNNQLQFLLHGITHNGDKMKLLFIFPSEPMSDYKDLALLHDREINLSANNCTVKIDDTTLQNIEGKLHFKRVQLLRIDGLLERAILSGVFELSFMQDGVSSIISNGRFDLGITNSVFYYR